MERARMTRALESSNNGTATVDSKVSAVTFDVPADLGQNRQIEYRKYIDRIDIQNRQNRYIEQIESIIGR